MENDRILVVGGGSWGLSAAIALAEAGQSVALVEQGAMGSGASGRAAGILSSHLREALDIRLSIATRRIIEELEAWARDRGFPEGVGVMSRVGGLTLAFRNHRRPLKALVKRVRSAGGTAEFVKGRRLRKFAIGLRELKGTIGVWSADDAIVDAPRFVALLRRRAQEVGVALHSGRRIALEVDGGAIQGVRDASGLIRAERVVLAAGAWSKRLAEPVGLRLSLKPYRTQLMRMRLDRADGLPIVHDTTVGAYFRPDGDGAVLVGDGTETVESDPERYAEIADGWFLESARKAIQYRVENGAAAATDRAWTGLCVGTPDRWPLLGPVPSIRGLHLMVGDNGYGVMRSLALGRWVAHAVSTGALPPEAQAMAAARFDLTQSHDFEIREGFELWPKKRAGG